MRQPTQASRDEHRRLLHDVERIRSTARELGWIPWAERRAAVDQVLGFLNETLVPHTEAAERVLDPEWSRLVEAIRARIARLAETDRSDTEQLQELLYGLHALITVQLEKEEEIQLASQG